LDEANRRLDAQAGIQNSAFSTSATRIDGLSAVLAGVTFEREPQAGKSDAGAIRCGVALYLAAGARWISLR
jgi:hypothetical protein